MLFRSYRGPDEVKKLRESRDCLAMFRERVTEAGLLDTADLNAIDSEAEALIDGAVAKAKVAPPPTAADLLTDVYVTY